jgi:small redox-active disulfide protein 2
MYHAKEPVSAGRFGDEHRHDGKIERDRMNIRVYGPGCTKCETLVELVTRAAEQTGLTCEIEKVTDMGNIIGAGVITTPGLEIDGEMILQGKVPTLDQLVSILSDHSE